MDGSSPERKSWSPTHVRGGERVREHDGVRTEAVVHRCIARSTVRRHPFGSPRVDGRLSASAVRSGRKPVMMPPGRSSRPAGPPGRSSGERAKFSLPGPP